MEHRNDTNEVEEEQETREMTESYLPKNYKFVGRLVYFDSIHLMLKKRKMPFVWMTVRDGYIDSKHKYLASAIEERKRLMWDAEKRSFEKAT